MRNENKSRRGSFSSNVIAFWLLFALFLCVSWCGRDGARRDERQRSVIYINPPFE
jgi:hypothetical protein